MELQQIHFDAYKSLVGKTLEKSHSCIGLVGINESGKSNVLSGIAKLSDDQCLVNADSPKMSRKLDPCIRFTFVLSSRESSEVVAQIEEMQSRETAKHLLLGDGQNISVTYHVRFDKKAQGEERYFTIDNASIAPNIGVLRQDARIDDRVVAIGDGFVPLKDVVFISEEEVRANDKLAIVAENLDKLKQELSTLEKDVARIAASIEKEKTTAETKPDEEKSASRGAVISGEKSLEAKRAELEKVQVEIEKLEERLKGYNLQGLVRTCRTLIKQLGEKVAEHQKSSDELCDSPPLSDTGGHKSYAATAGACSAS